MILDLYRTGGLWLLLGVFVIAATPVTLNFCYKLLTAAVATVFPHRSSPFDAVDV